VTKPRKGKDWRRRQETDFHVKASREAGYRSRAAYKLLELAPFLTTGMTAVDLGAAPGGWTQVLAQRVGVCNGGGRVVAVDTLPMRDIAGVGIIRGDFLQENVRRQTLALLGGAADVVTSDMSPNLTGIHITDQERAAALGVAAMAFARRTLRVNGRLILKAFEGEHRNALHGELRQSFKTVKICRPQATRASSREFYFVASGFRQQFSSIGKDADSGGGGDS